MAFRPQDRPSTHPDRLKQLRADARTGGNEREGALQIFGLINPSRGAV